MIKAMIMTVVLLIPVVSFSQSFTLAAADLSLQAAVWEFDEARGVSYENSVKAAKDIENKIAKRVIAMQAEKKSCLLIKRELKQQIMEKTASVPEASESPASFKKLIDSMADYAAAWCLDSR